MKSDRKTGPIRDKGLFVFILVIAAACILAVSAIWHFFQLTRISRYTEVEVDGSVTTLSSGTNFKSLEKYQKASPAAVISGDSAADQTEACIVFSGLNDDSTVNAEVLAYLDEHGVKAAFAVPAIHARENQDFIRKILKSGNAIISGGLDGTEKSQKDAASLCENFIKSRTILNEETGMNIKTLYCTGISGTSMQLKAASGGGYKQVAVADDSDLIQSDTFKTKEDAENYVSRLRGTHIITISLDEKAAAVHQEPSISSATAAIDKQASLQEAQHASDEKEEVSISQEALWLMESLREQDIQIVSLSDLPSSEGEKYIESKLSEDSDQPIVYRSVLTDEKRIALCINNLENTEQYEALKTLLREYKVTCSFFVTGNTDSDLCQSILEDGYDLENAGKTGKVFSDVQSMYDEISGECQNLQKLGTSGVAYLIQNTDYLTQIRSACAAADLIPVLPQNPQQISEGAFYLFDASDLTSVESLFQRADEDGFRVQDIRTLLDCNGTIPLLTNEELEQTRQRNHGEAAEFWKTIPTTEAALALTFGNIRNEAAALDAVDRLKSAGACGTFFVSFDEMRTYTSTIEQLINSGQEIGLAYTPGGSYSSDYNGMAYYLHDSLCYMQWRYGYAPGVIMLYEDPKDSDVLEAIHAYGLKAVGASNCLIKDGTQDIAKNEVDDAIEEQASTRFTRGGLEFFNLSFYSEDEKCAIGESTILGEMVSSAMKEFVDSIAYVSADTGQIADDSRYDLKTVSELIASDRVYTLSESEQDTVSLNKNVLTSMSDSDQQFEYIRNHYLGSNFIVNAAKMPGFTDDEISQLDKTGKLTDDKVLFLTFDDWGTDASINKLLYVLKKYDVKATFFILTEHIDSNPNLLRAIAEDGHEIASHSNSHMALADANEDYTEYSSLTEEEQKKMRSDLVTSYSKLNKYVGDISVDGKKSLSLDFRPPTLEVSKEGLYQVFDVGFLYSVSGDVTTNDYKRTDLQNYVYSMAYGSPSSEDDFKVGNGSVIVMHMTENAALTAQMLDVLIPRWQKEGYSFARVDSYTNAHTP